MKKECPFLLTVMSLGGGKLRGWSERKECTEKCALWVKEKTIWENNEAIETGRCGLINLPPH